MKFGSQEWLPPVIRTALTSAETPNKPYSQHKKTAGVLCPGRAS
jgi:hypothetical protein